MENIFLLPKDLSREESVELLYCGKDTRIERIVSCGQITPQGSWYDQDEDEWVMVIQGYATIGMEGEEICLRKGDYLLLPAHCRHRVTETSSDPPCIWLCVFVRPQQEIAYFE